MSDISPNTVVYLYEGVPLTPDYEHTMYFANALTQAGAFGLVSGVTPQKSPSLTILSNTFQRVNRNTIRVGLMYSQVYKCNYMVFRNSNYENKNFYAFILKVNYINNATVEIVYEIDVMQTWLMSDLSMRSAYVLREHAMSDNIGDNIEPETVDLGEYVFNEYGAMTQLLSDLCVIVAVADYDIYDSSLQMYDNVYSGSVLKAFNYNDIAGINAFISTYNQKPDAITSIYMCPKIFITDSTIPSGSGGGVYVTNRASANTITLTNVSVITPGQTTLNGYTPKNNKLYTYPYNFYSVDNGNGDGSSFRYEFFENNIPIFQIRGCVTQPVQAILNPCNYKGLVSGGQLAPYNILLTESVSLDNYPLCSWVVDYYQAYIAQNAVPTGIKILSSLLPVVSGNAYSSTMSGFSTIPNVRQFDSNIDKNSWNVGMSSANPVSVISNSISSYYSASIHADIFKGNVNTGNVNVGSNKQRFNGGRCSITRNKALIIDNYFSKYGYATNQIKAPNLSGRPHWNYVRCVDPSYTGSAPADDEAIITGIFAKGITFWKSLNEVGVYSSNNAIGA